MQQLTVDPPVPFLIPDTSQFTIALVGCGGTGSHIAQSLARLAAHCQSVGGPRIQLAFIDGDVVEEKNIGRQLFGPQDRSKNKAQVLAARFSAVFGLSIVAFPQMLERQTMRPEGYAILVGAVDGAKGRQAIAHQMRTWDSYWRLWIDCGNHEASGQVVVGSAGDAKGMQGAVQNGLCTRLPTAPMLYPELLEEQPTRPREDCAEAMIDNAQSLMVNQAIASVAAQYIYQIVIHRRLEVFCTTIDLRSLTMRSLPITAKNLSEATGVSIDELHGIKAKKTKKARRAA